MNCAAVRCTIRHYARQGIPLPGFERNAERKQSFAEAEATHRAMAETYSDFGYELVDLPRATLPASMTV